MFRVVRQQGKRDADKTKAAFAARLNGQTRVPLPPAHTRLHVLQSRRRPKAAVRTSRTAACA